MRWLAVAALGVSALTAMAGQTPVQTAQAKSPTPAKKPDPPRLTEMQKAIEEFKAQTRNLGLRADSPASARIKSAGAARWHGRLFENFRNDFLDAVPHEIRQRGSNKSLLRRNQFGFNIGGPVIIPKLFNGSRSTFFSVSYEGVRERISRSYLRTVPIAPEREGDFSQTVDSAGNPLPVFDPVSTRPNPEYNAAQPVSEENLQYIRDPFPGNSIPPNRLDTVAIAALREYPRANDSVGPYFRNNYFAVAPETNIANGMIIKLDHNFAERHRIDTQVSYSNGFAGYARLFPTVADPNPPDRSFSSRRGSVQHTFTASPRTVYSWEVEASSEGSHNEGDIFPSYRFGDYAPMGRINPNVRSVRNNFWLTLSASAKRDKHSVRGGIQALHQQLHAFASAYPAGSFRFTSGLTSLPGINNTGHAFASYLLGLSDWAETSVVASPSYFRRNQVSLYVRDTYEVTRHLTLSGGLNLEIATPRIEKYNRQSTVDLAALNPANNMPGALVAAARDGYGRAFQPAQVRLEPSVSLAWNPASNSNTVARLSYSRSYQPVGLGAGQFGTQGFNAYPTFPSENVQLFPAVTLRNGLPLAGTVTPDLRPDAVNDMVADLINMSSLIPRLQSVGASLEHEVLSGTVATLGYYHYDGKNMQVGSSGANPNAIHLDALQYRDRLNDDSFRRFLRPFPQYRGFDLNGQWPAGKYQRDAGYLRVEKRASGGLGLSASYEFSKQMDDYSGPYGVQDFYNRANEWSQTAGNNPHRLSLTYSYDVPFGPAKGLFGYTDWRRYVVEGWTISGMSYLYSGDPLALRPMFNNTGGVIGALNVNVVPGIDPRPAEQGPDMWFNPAAFAQPPDFTPGNASRTHPFLLGPGSQNHDLSLTKRFALAADRTVEFSAAAFNFVNHANWTDPDVVIGPEDSPNVNAGKIIGSRGGRVIQLGLRYSF
jgi:hypothetical protein